MKVFRYVRITLYVIIVISCFVLKFVELSNLGNCYINENFGIACPSCGITRATKAILDFNLPLAISYNAYYVLVLLPIFLILLIEDVYCIIKNKRSLVEVIFGM